MARHTDRIEAGRAAASVHVERIADRTRTMRERHAPEAFERAFLGLALERGCSTPREQLARQIASMSAPESADMRPRFLK
ncbi:hypothetical protein [Collinsella ihumii]|uniref:hypothetical protein n=1 Tax=Collinsella ihumii TaxID=1720204 RepID=UPI0025AA9078|nr:hypothetical protein [Collinsella ihumii]MDN0055185.1 hypothetical protein [Collinsella ihumii]